MKIEGLRSGREEVGGIVFFGRMLDKIRLHALGRLPAEYNRGSGFDGRCCRFLGIDYGKLVARVLRGGADEEILQWCFAWGREPIGEEVEIWNQFMAKRGWRDDSTSELEKMKAAHGLADRADIQTFFDFHDADEGRL
jgi:gluconokinase